MFQFMYWFNRSSKHKSCQQRKKSKSEKCNHHFTFLMYMTAMIVFDSDLPSL